MKNNIQYERKFLVKKLPDLSDWKKQEIQQWYLTSPNDIKSVRLREYDNGDCYFDNIYEKGKIREKIGQKINYLAMESYKSFPSIKKTRYKKQINDDILMIIDIFENGLKLIEIETYKNENTIDNFEIPDWFGKEVTDDIKYNNNWLAYNI